MATMVCGICGRHHAGHERSPGAFSAICAKCVDSTVPGRITKDENGNEIAPVTVKTRRLRKATV